MIAFDLTGLEGYTLTDARPVVRTDADPFQTGWFRGAGRPMEVAHCPECDHPLMEFVQGRRIAFQCWPCRLVWLTEQIETPNVVGHEALVEQIVKVAEIEARRAEEAA